VRSWRWLLFDDQIEIALPPGGEASFEGWELGYGPVNACLSV
jgi:hypothetical protein